MRHSIKTYLQLRDQDTHTDNMELLLIRIAIILLVIELLTLLFI